MDFRIGFPVDAGSADLSFIVTVRLTIAESHFCKGGGASGLRENSGAAYVFKRTQLDIQQKYRYEFALAPMPNNKTRPNNLCDFGYSDSAACALAIEQHRDSYPKKPTETPLLLISCSFVSQPQQQGLKNLLLEKVTTDDEIEARESLANKWQAACKNKALALILHEDDAKILGKELSIKLTPLDKLDFLEPLSTPHLISCQTDQWPLLLKKLKKPRVSYGKQLTLITLLIIVACYLWWPKKNTLQTSIIQISKKATMADIYKEGNGPSLQNVKNYVRSSSFNLKDHKNTLLANLEHKDWRIRLVSLYLIAEIKDKKFAEKHCLQLLAKDHLAGFAASKVLVELQPRLEIVLPLIEKPNNHNIQHICTVLKNTTFETSTETFLNLTKYINHESRRIVATVMHLLKSFEVIPPKVIPIFFAKLQASGISIRNMSMQILMLSPNTVPFVIEKLQKSSHEKPLWEILENKPHTEINIQTMRFILQTFSSNKLKLKQIKKNILLKIPATKLLPFLLQSLQAAENRYVKSGIMYVLSHINNVPRLPKLSSTLLELLTHKQLDTATYKVVLACIKCIGPQIKDDALPILFSLLSKKRNKNDEYYYREVRREVIKCLANMGKIPLPKLNYVWNLLGDIHFYRGAIIDLWLNNSSPQLVASLIERLPSLTVEKQAVVVYTLGEMKAKKSATTLQTLNSPVKYIKVLVIEALAKIEGPLNSDLLLEIVVDDSEPPAQMRCLQIFERFQVKKSLPILRKLQKHHNPYIRAKSFIAIANISRNPKLLIKALNDKSAVVRTMIAEEFAYKGGLQFLDDILELCDQPQNTIPTLFDAANYSLVNAKRLLNHNEKIRIIGIKSLSKFKEKSLPIIYEILEKKQSNAELEAIAQTLIKINNKEALILLQELLSKDLLLELEVKVRRAIRHAKLE
ncbi:HEAT repeat domain-containing protein [Candidatus Uabimicrobium sp. HlEnr_7]|uniref:HEAT repeat domain-containing protein n=1 Tax=Candidatus Uabimicrobium helgolandensis TaxID=3095367 RepID=UPI00355627F9